MGIWFQRRGRHLRRHMLLQQLEDRVVLDASVNPVQQDNQVSSDTGGGAVAAENAADSYAESAGVEPNGGAQASPNAETLSQVYGRNLNEVLVSNAPGEIQSVQATATDQGQDSGGLNVVLISNAVSDADIIKAAAASDAIVLTYDAQHDNLSTIAAELTEVVQNTGHKIGALALVEHGSEGVLKFGADQINFLNLQNFDSAFVTLGQNLAAGAQIQFFGCNVAQDAFGQALIGRIAMLTHSDVFASEDTTGTGFNWDLEFASNSAASAVHLFDPAKLATANSELEADLFSDIRLLDDNAGADANFIAMNGEVFFLRYTSTYGSELWVSDGTVEGTHILKDIRPGADSGSLSNFTIVHLTGGDRLFFSAYDGTQTELWMTDGTSSGTVMVKDIAGSTTSSNPNNLTAAGNALFFTANDGSSHGVELWKSDGTSDGTAMVKDITPNSGSSSFYGGTFLAVGSKVFFKASTTALNHGYEYWASDGTSDGTNEIIDLNSGPGEGIYNNVTVVGTHLFFTTTYGSDGTELWMTDGTPGTSSTMEKDIYEGTGSSTPANLTPVGSTLFFTATDATYGTELWKSDGTLAGTVIVKNITSTPTDSGNTDFAAGSFKAIDTKLFFKARTANLNHGYEYWASDGSSDGTNEIIDLNSGTGDGSYNSVTVVGSHLFFTTWYGTHGTELWMTDGTPGTQLTMEKDIYPLSGSSSPANLFAVGNTLYFNAYDGTHGTELWKSDGTLDGTVLVKDMTASGSTYFSSTMAAVGSKLFFVANDNSGNGYDLWVSDGSSSGTQDVFNEPGSSNYFYYLTASGDKVFFISDDGTHGREISWADGTRFGFLQGTSTSDSHAGWVDTIPASFSPASLVNLNGIIYFTATDDTHGLELWRTDGTTAGTFMVKDIWPGSGTSSPTSLTVLGDSLYFVASDPTYGTELFRVTPSGLPDDPATTTVDESMTTVVVKDIRSGSGSSSVAYLKAVGDDLFFKANDGTNGDELWLSSPSGLSDNAATTAIDESLTTDMVRNSDGSSSFYFEGPNSFWVVGSKLFFKASKNSDPTYTNHGYELWSSDGTYAGTGEIVDLSPGSGSGTYYSFTVVGDKLFFNGNWSGRGLELFWADGTTFGFVPDTSTPDSHAGYKDIWSGSTGSNPTYLTALGNTLYFRASDGTNGNELWKSEGTVETTGMVKDIYQGSSDSNPANLTVMNGLLYFTAYDYVSGRTPTTYGTELWRTDGTSAGTLMVKDINEGSNGSYPSNFTVIGDTLYFTATDATHGVELWKSSPSGLQDITETATVDESMTTVMVKDITSGGGTTFAPGTFMPVGSKLFFQAAPAGINRELWWSDGTDAGTGYVDVVAGSGDGTYSGFTQANGTLFFVTMDKGSDGTSHGTELWKSGGSAATTVMYDLMPGSGSSLPTNLLAVSDPTFSTTFNSRLYFAASDLTHGTELWMWSNSAPVMTDTDPFLTAVTEDSSNGAGNYVKDIVDSDVAGHGVTHAITDADGTDTGIVIVSADQTNGTWQYSLDDGAHWNNFGSVSAGTAIALKADNFTKVRFEPNANFDTTATFGYRAWDGFDGKANGSIVDTSLTGDPSPFSTAVETATIAMTPIDDPPTATHMNQTLTVAEDSGAHAFVDQIVVTDPDTGDTLTATLTLANTAAGDLSDNDGATYNSGTGIWTRTGTVNQVTAALANVTFTPKPNWNGSTAITTHVEDAAHTGPANGSIAVTVTPVNDAPVAVPDSYITDEDTAVTGNVLSNDTDIDSATLTASLTTAPSHGAVTLNADGSFAYTPAANYNGPDGFTYTVSDGALTDTETVSITVNPVNDAPVAAPDSYTTDEDTAVTGNVLTNDTDIDSATLTASLGTAPSHGAVTLNEDGLFTYTPAANYNGSDSFTYTVSDGALTDTETVSITVNPVNDPVTGVALSNSSIAENQASGSVVGNFSSTDADAGDTHTYTLVGGAGDADNASFSIEGNALKTNGVFNFEVKDSYSIRVRSTDQGGLTYEQAFTITVSNVDEAPTAVSQSVSVNEDGTLDITVMGHDDDRPSVDTVAFEISDGVDHGTLSASGPVVHDGAGNYTQQFTYVPAGNYNGPDSFNFVLVTPTGPWQGFESGANVYSHNDATNSIVVGDLNADGNLDVVTGSWQQTSKVYLGDGIGGFTYSGELGTAGYTVELALDDLNSDGKLDVVEGRTWGEEGRVFLGNGDGTFTYVGASYPTGKNVKSIAVGDLNGDGKPDVLAGDGDQYVWVYLGNGDGTFTANGSLNGYSNTQSIQLADVNADGNLDAVTATYGWFSHVYLGNGAGSLSHYSRFPSSNPDNSRDMDLGDVNGDGKLDAVVANYQGTCKLYVGNGAGSFSYSGNIGGYAEARSIELADFNGDGNLDAVIGYYSSQRGQKVFLGDGQGGFTYAETLGTGTDVTGSIAVGDVNGDGRIDVVAGNYGQADKVYLNQGQLNEQSPAATVEITVSPINDAPVAAPDSYTTDEDIAVTGNVLTNDTDIDSATLTASLATAPSHGAVTLNADGSFTYTPAANYNGSDSFTYTVSDGALTDTETVSVTVNPVNDAPVAVPDGYTTDEDTAVNGNVLSNDTDIDSATLTASLGTAPSHGTVTLNEDGSFTYTPAANYNGSDSFTYIVSDGALTDTETVSITVNPVNDAPVAAPDGYTTDEDTAVTGNVLTNDTDIDSATLTAGLATAPSHGAVTLNEDGSFTYTPAANYNGSDSFTYTVSDGALTDTETVSITVNPVNDAPVAVPDSYTTDEDTAVTGNVLTNDTDIDSATLTASLATPPSHGAVTLDEDGSFIYTPAANYNGSDSFTYTVSDGALTDTETVSIAVSPVNDAPVAVPDSYTTDEDTAVNGNVLTNDTDIDSATLTASLATPPSHGAVTLNEDGSFTYTPAANYNGPDTFTYTVSDGALTDTETVSVTVNPVNDAPVAVPDSYTTDEDTAVNGNVLSNDTDIDSATLTASLLTAPSHGAVTLDEDGSFTYTPAANYNGPDTFTYTVSDGALTDTETVSVTVNPVNDAPVTVPDSYTTDEDTAVSGNVLSNDTDIDSATLTASLLAAPSHGAVTLNEDGSFTYTPAANYNGSDSFTYTVSDGALTDTETVSVTVSPVNDAPVNTVPGSVTATVNTLTPVTGISISDPDAGSTLVQVTLGVTHGTLQVSSVIAGGLTAGQISGNGTSSVVLTGTLAQIDATLADVSGLQYQSDLNYTGSDTLTVSSNDLGATGSGGALTTFSTVPMTISSWALEFESTGWATDYWRHADGAGGYDVLFAYDSSAQQYYQHEGSSSSPYGNAGSWHTLGDPGVIPAGALLDGAVHALKADGSLTFQFDSTYHKVNYTSTLLGQFSYDFDHGIADGLWYQKAGYGTTDWVQAGETEQVWFQYSADPNHWNLGTGFEYEYHPVYGVSYWRQADGSGGYDVLFAYAQSAGQWYQHEGTTSSPYGTQWYTLGAAGALGADYGLLDGNTHHVSGELSYAYDGMQHRSYVTSTLLGQFYYDFDRATGDGLWYQKVGSGPSDWAQAGETEQVWFQYGADPNHWNLGNGFEYEFHSAWGVSYWRQADGLGGYDVMFAYAQGAGQWYQNEGTTASPYGTQWYALGAAGALGTDYGLLDGNTHQLAAGLSYSYDGMQHRAYVTSTLLGQFYYDFDHSMGDRLWYQKVGPGITDWAQAGETEQVWFQYGADPNHWNLGNGFEYEYNPVWGVSYWRHGDGMGGYDVLFAYAQGAEQWYQNEGTTSSPYGAQWYTLGAAGALGTDYGLLDGNTHQLASGLSYRFDAMQHRTYVTSTLLGQFYYDFDHSTGDGLWYQKVGPGPSDWAQAGETEQVWFQYGATPYAPWDLGNGFAYEYNPAWGVSYWRHADGMGGYDVLFAYAHSAGQWYQNEGTTSSPYGAQWYTLGAAGALGDSYGLLDGNTHQLASGLSYRFDAMQHRTYVTSTLLGQFYYDFDHSAGDGLWYQKIGPGPTDWAQAGEAAQVWFQYGADPNHWDLGNGFAYEYNPAWGVSYWRQSDGMGGYDVLFAYAHSAGQWYQHEGTTSSPYGTQWYALGAAGALGDNYGLLDGNFHEVAEGLTYGYDAMDHRSYWMSDLMGQFYYDYDHAAGDGLWYQYRPASMTWQAANETEQVWFQYGPDPNHWTLGSGFEYEFSTAYGTSYWRDPIGGPTYNVLYAYSASTEQWYQQNTPTINPYGDAWYTIPARPTAI